MQTRRYFKCPTGQHESFLECPGEVGRAKISHCPKCTGVQLCGVWAKHHQMLALQRLCDVRSLFV